IRLYCWGKENRVNILKSIDEGPFQMGTRRETLTEGTEGALHLGPERPRVYSDFISEGKDRNQAIIQDGKVVIQNVQGRQNRGQGNNARGAGAAGYGGAQNRVGYANPGQARQIKTTAMENGVTLDKEQLLFIAGGQDNVVDDDVDEQPIQDLALNVDNVFQADDCDAFDSDDAVCEHHEVHERHGDVQPNYVVDFHTGYMSDSNMIPYDQYVKDNAMQVVQRDVSVVPNYAYMMILNDMYEPLA
nr:hypothetical protein [Tanacetum cinerariifolium]